MRIETTIWKPPRQSSTRSQVKGVGASPSKSIEFINGMVPGDVARIFHDDVMCEAMNDKILSNNCTLTQGIIRLRVKRGWKMEMYHERTGVAVVRRTG